MLSTRTVTKELPAGLTTFRKSVTASLSAANPAQRMTSPPTMMTIFLDNHITQTIDPLIASVSTVLIVGTLALMILLDRIMGLERVLVGNK